MQILLRIVQNTKFKTDSKRLMRSGRFSESDEKKLFHVIETLAKGKQLEQKHRDHPLAGNWSNYRECHIKPDLLLIYKIEGDTLKLVRLGSHSDLF